jgi:hypothetical protein
MRATTPALALVLAAAAAPADAATVARTVPAVGPVLAGGQVAWGNVTHDGRLRVLRAAPRTPVIAVPRATAPKTRRGFVHTPWALAASRDAVAALVYTGTTRQTSSDSASTAESRAVLGGPWDAPALLSGAVTERGDEPCVPGRAVPLAVAVDGPRVAVADVEANCDTAEPAYRIVIHDGDKTTVVFPGGWVQALDLAGTHVAWALEGGEGLHIADARTGAVERTVGRSSRIRWVGDLALAPSGALAFTYTRGGAAFGSDVGYLASPTAKVRRLARHVADRGLGLAGGRVLYEHYRDRDYRRSELLLRRVRGGAPRRLARLRAGHRRIGDIDLDATRATWAVGGAHARIVLRRL